MSVSLEEDLKIKHFLLAHAQLARAAAPNFATKTRRDVIISCLAVIIHCCTHCLSPSPPRQPPPPPLNSVAHCLSHAPRRHEPLHTSAENELLRSMSSKHSSKRNLFLRVDVPACFASQRDCRKEHTLNSSIHECCHPSSLICACVFCTTNLRV